MILRKYLIILPIFMFILGCGRVGTESYRVHVSGKTVSKKGDFDIIRKSQYMQSSNSYVKQGHYSLLFKYSGDERDLDGILYENGSKYSSSEAGEAKVVIDPSENSITNNILLLLDFSGSIIKDRALREQLKQSVISFIDKVSYKKKVKIAIYYFNAKERITSIVSDPLDDGEKLKDEISRLDDSYFERIIEENLISTNLYGGVVEATQIACRWVGNCTNETISSTPTFDKDNFEFASVVVFTDGRDTARWANESTMFSTIKKNKALFYQGVGVGDADEKFIDKMSTDSGIYEKRLDTNAIESVFDDLTSWANSFYEARYCPAAQKGTVDIEIDVSGDKEPIGTIKEKKVKLHSNEGFRCDLFN
jgi:uncharacterized protein YegL